MPSIAPTSYNCEAVNMNCNSLYDGTYVFDSALENNPIYVKSGSEIELKLTKIFGNVVWSISNGDYTSFSNISNPVYPSENSLWQIVNEEFTILNSYTCDEGDITCTTAGKYTAKLVYKSSDFLPKFFCIIYCVIFFLLCF